jgi:dihydrofolate reductase
MRKVILLEHMSLDGFLAGPKGEMDWIRVDEELFGPVTAITDNADTAIYGRVTYQMMEGYWPMAGDKPEATRHDIDHSRWYKAAKKLVFSRTLTSLDSANTQIKSDIESTIAEETSLPGRNLLLIGSPSLAREFTRLGLIDEFRLYVNPVVLGSGLPLFGSKSSRFDLKLTESKTFGSGVVGLFYTRRE